MSESRQTEHKPNGHEPTEETWSIREVADRFDLKPYVLRYWETEFEQLHPAKNAKGHRVYRSPDLEVLERIIYLLKTRKFTIEGAKQEMAEPVADKEEHTELELRRSLRELRGFLKNLLLSLDQQP